MQFRLIVLVALSIVADARSWDDAKTVPMPVNGELPIATAAPSKSDVPPTAVEAKKDVAELRSEGATKDDAPQFSVSWANGLEFISKKKDFRYHVGGRMHLDSAWFNAPDPLQTGPGGVGSLQDGSTIRRARVRLDGTMYEVVEWIMEYDFAAAVANGNAAPFDAAGVTEFSVSLVKIPNVGTIAVGNMKEPYGFEHLTGVRYLDFIERSTNYDAFSERFSLGYTPGAMIRNNYAEDNRGTWWLGIFHDTNAPFGYGVGDQHYAYDARITYLPLWDEGNERWLHVGASISHRNLNNDRVRLRIRPSLRSGPGPLTAVLADTGTLAATIQDIANIELVLVSGPWTWQSECYASWVHDAETIPAAGPGTPLGTLFYTGWYTQVLYFLTGETRPYNRKIANFERVRPIRNAKWGDDSDGECSNLGCGAWQIGARFSHTDLLDVGIGAVLDDCTIGLNWYLNPNVKVQCNYIATHRTAYQAEGWIHGIGTRLAIDF